jgi:hypothetical protein
MTTGVKQARARAIFRHSKKFATADEAATDSRSTWPWAHRVSAVRTVSCMRLGPLVSMQLHTYTLSDILNR